MNSNEPKPEKTTENARRSIRSFVSRTGRLTPGQQRALEELLPHFGIHTGSNCIDFYKEFGRQADVTLEIGFGNGENLIALARQYPHENFLGIEVHDPGVGHCLLRIKEEELTNLRVIRTDAVEVLHSNIADAALTRINLFFPDPWHKKRHHKRRIVQADFAELLARKLTPGGIFHVATDWPNYAEHIEAVMNDCEAFESTDNIPDDRIKTRFDLRGERLGHSNWERAWCTRSN